MWDLPRPGLEPASPALAGRLSTTAPPGKPPHAGLLMAGPSVPLEFFKLSFNTNVTLQAVSFM